MIALFKFVIKSVLSFILSFFILTIPINEKPLFMYLAKATSPLTAQFYKKINASLNEGGQIFKSFFSTIFSASVPVPFKSNDQLESSMAGYDKGNSEIPVHSGDFTNEERKKLEEAITEGD
jgi:hypothetical protein